MSPALLGTSGGPMTVVMLPVFFPERANLLLRVGTFHLVREISSPIMASESAIFEEPRNNETHTSCNLANESSKPLLSFCLVEMATDAAGTRNLVLEGNTTSEPEHPKHLITITSCCTSSLAYALSLWSARPVLPALSRQTPDANRIRPQKEPTSPAAGPPQYTLRRIGEHVQMVRGIALEPDAWPGAVNHVARFMAR
eukprot:3510716-Amphidinium_carterae.1